MGGDKPSFPKGFLVRLGILGGLAAKDFFDQLDELEFQGLWIVAEGPHLADDGAIEVLFETQDPIRTIKDALDTQEIIKGNLQIEGLAHGIFL